MPQLSAANITIIVELVLPFCDTENKRRTLIDSIFSGASSKPDIDTGGAPLESTNRLVSRLIAYGEIESGKPAVWALLEAIHPRVGIDKQKQIDDLRSVVYALSVSSVENAAATDAAGLVSSPNEARTSDPVFLAKPNRTSRDSSGSIRNGASQTSRDGNNTLTCFSVILGLVLAFMGVVVGVVALLPPAQRDPLLYAVGLIPASGTPTPSHTPSLTPTVTYSPTFTLTPPPTATVTPTPLPLEGFSVVVAGFASIDADGNLVEDQTADRVSDAVFEALQALGQIQFLVGWRDPFVGHILEQTPEERYQHAVALGETLGADVVIYGIVSSDDYYITLRPSFYFAATWVDQDGDLFAHDALLPIQFLRSSAGNELGSDFRVRLQVISVFLQGLELYLTGNYNGAYTTFLEAGEVANNFVPSIYVYAGNAANRNGDYDNALAAFDRVLDIEPDFARALIGRGVTLAQMAQPRLSDTYDPTAQLGDEASCTDTPPDDSRRLALLALRCFQAAVDSPNPSIETQSTLRAYVNMGQVNAWLADLPGGERSRWTDAESYFEQALGIFNAIPESSRGAFNYFGALAYAGLAQVNNRVRTEPDSAVCVEVQALYQQAVDLLLNNADRSAYVQSLIDNYEASSGEIAACALD